MCGSWSVFVVISTQIDFKAVLLTDFSQSATVEYMGKAMEKAIRNMPGVSFGVLTKESFWKEFFETEVDRNGAEIECVN